MKASRRLAPLLALGLVIIGCRQPSLAETVTIARFPVDSLEHLVATDHVAFEAERSHDGGGSLRIETDEPRVIPLFAVTEVDIEDTRLLYRARLRTEDLEGRAYLEMWCVFEGLGEYFSRGLADPLSGTTDWTERQIPFFLKAGENPDRLELNLVVDGSGTVWIDDIVVSAVSE